MTDTATKALSKMNRAELEAEATRLGYEDAESVDNMGELAEIVRGLREQESNQPGADPDAGTDDQQPDGDSGDQEPTDPDADAGTDPEPTPEATEIPENCIRVKARGDANRCTLFEQNPLHPGGEVFITGGQTAIVGKTPAVMKMLGVHLIEVE